MPWSLRKPLLALENTCREVCRGMICISTLTEPVQLLTHFKNWNAVPGGSSQPHTHCWACPESRSLHVNGVLILELKDLQPEDQVTFAALK